MLLWGCWLTSSWGNEGMNFYSASTLVAAMLSIGVYATILTCDMVFSEQYKQNTMKNEVAYGLPRVRIYLGKLAVSALVSILAAVVMVVLYVTGCWAPVSYTHLDVYKRQVHGAAAIHVAQGEGAIIGAHEQDVYKRQKWFRPQREAESPAGSGSSKRHRS